MLPGRKNSAGVGAERNGDHVVDLDGGEEDDDDDSEDDDEVGLDYLQKPGLEVCHSLAIVANARQISYGTYQGKTV